MRVGCADESTANGITTSLNEAIARMGDTPWSDFLQDDRLRQLAQYVEFRSVEASEFVFQKGDPCNYVYWIVEGAVEITACDAVSLAMLAKGQLFGEIALIDGGLRSASVRAYSDSQLMMLSARRFHELKSQHPEVALQIVLQIASVLCTRLRDANVNVDLSFFPAPLVQ